MKKIFFSLLAFVMVFTSCMDKEEIDIEYESKFQVSAANLFDTFHEVKQGDFNLNEYGQWKLNLHAFIYNDMGELVLKKEFVSDDITGMLEFNLNLEPGDYTAVSVANFEGDYEGTHYDFWKIKEGAKLEDLQIQESDRIVPSVFETLGLTKTQFSIGDSNEVIRIDVKPVTSLLEIFVWDRDLTGFGQNGFSEIAPFTEQISIYAPVQKQVVKFENGEISFDYVAQDIRYPMFLHSPMQQVQTSSITEVYGYRALLPETQKYFYWTVNMVPGSGKQFGIQDYQESANTNKLDFKSGEQYVMDLLFDGLYLFVDKYNPANDAFARYEKYSLYLNKIAFDKIMDRKFETILGASTSFVEAEFGECPLISDNMWLYPDYNRYIDYLSFTFDDSSNQVKVITLTFSKVKPEWTDIIVEYLKDRFIVYDKGTSAEQKAFISQDGSVGVIWDKVNNMLLYLKLK